ncbi:MAG: GDP-mannose 4,6-dehydratase, partial [Deinococcus sp.]|nr:GDP-mannose 4,6-dehydratase [Deinococcus sp.]
ARIFNTYGPRMRVSDGRVVSNFIVQALAGKPLTVYGDGRQTRSFQYVSDLVEGVARLMAVSHPGPVNLGNPEEYPVLALAQLVKELTGSCHIVLQPLPEDDPRQRCPDITLASTLLKWKPQVSLVEGLRQTIAWFQEHVGIDQPVQHRSGKI